MWLSSITRHWQICYNGGMATITQMRNDLLNAHQLGFDNKVRIISGIDDAPKDATEIFILYLALEAARGREYALDACKAVKRWADETEV